MAYTTINKGSSYFNTKLYTGTGATNNITGVGFKPDLVWIKNRGNTDWHRLLDAVRGATNELYSNATNAETAQAQSLQTFNTDGFTLGTLAEVNGNANNFASWNWLANGAGVSNTAGTIASTVSANTTAGFSVCTLTTNAGGSGSYGHGLGVAPSFIIQKSRTNAQDWYVYHKSLGASAWLELNKTNAATTGNTAVWSGTEPNSTVVNLGSGWTNANHGNVVAYCFAEVKGFSKFGSYTGNGSADGPFIYTGFKPAFVLTKITNTTGNWQLEDNKRDPYNVNQYRLYPNLNNAEAASTDGNLDFLSNGFKPRTADGGFNGSGSTYIYMAFAENPFVSSTLVPTTAR